MRPFFHSGQNSFIDRAFPPPDFLCMPVAGIDITEGAVRFMELRGKGDKRVVKIYGEKKLPKGAISAGYIYKPEEVIKVLTEIRKETGFRFVNVSLPEEKAYLFKVEMPVLSGEELRDAISFRIEENVPVSAKDSIFDFVVMEGGESSEHLDVMVAVIPSKVSETYAGVVKAAGMTPLSLEIISQAVARAVAPSSKLSGSYLVLNFGESKTGLAVVSKGIVVFTSTVPVGFSTLDEIFSKTHGLSIDKVGELKASMISSGKQDMKSFLEVMEDPAILPLKEEIHKLNLYWSTHGINVIHEKTKIDKIILCGKDMALPAFSEYFHASTWIPAETANAWRNVFSFDKYIPPIPSHEALDYVGAIGLAMYKYV